MLMSHVGDLPTINRPVDGNSFATIPPGHIATTVGCAGTGNASLCVPVSSSARGRMLTDAVRISPQREGPLTGMVSRRTIVRKSRRRRRASGSVNLDRDSQRSRDSADTSALYVLMPMRV